MLIIKCLNVIEYVLPRILYGLVRLSSVTFVLEKVEEAFGNSFVMTAAPAAHAVFEIVLLEERSPVDTVGL